MKSRRIIAVLLLCLVLGGVIVWSLFVNFVDKIIEQEVSPQLFEVVEVVRGDLRVSVSGSGNIKVANEARLAFAVGGRIDKIYVEEGDVVTEGKVLAELDTSALELALTKAQVAPKRAKVAEERAKTRLRLSASLSVGKEFGRESGRELGRAETTPTTALRIEISYHPPLRVDALELELAKSEYEAAKQAVAEAKKQLEQAILIAPFDGVVASVDVDEGDTISTITTIVRLIDLTSMELEIRVWEQDIPRIRLNQRAIIEVDALPDVQFKGRVTSISPLSTVEAGVILYKVKIGFNDIPHGLKVGMSAEADIVIDERNNILLVPNRAIKQDGQGNQIVKVMVNEQIKERPVVIGISDGFKTEIVAGLDEGEAVAIER